MSRVVPAVEYAVPLRFGARHQPTPTGRSSAAIAAGRVIQVRLGRSSVRMTPAEARAFAVRLMVRAAKDPTVGLVVGYKPPGAKCERRVKLSQAEIRAGVESIYAAVGPRNEDGPRC
jgi:hypothetical protein